MTASSLQLKGILVDIIEGKTVKRAKHELKWEGRDVSADFINALTAQGFRHTTVGAVNISPGERVPAFHLHDGHAYFGWVFWEKFSQRRLRKLFGSAVRNALGDWAIQISEKQNSIIYANNDLKSEMDIENPSGF